MIELKNISYTYEKQIVFSNLSLSVERGEKVGIIGESGCGKSTLLKIVAGLYRPTEGTVLVDGVGALIAAFVHWKDLKNAKVISTLGYVYRMKEAGLTNETMPLSDEEV